MEARGRSDRALLLAAVAMLGFVVTPLLHGEEHRREAHEDEAETATVAEAWSAASGDPLDAFAFALAHVHGAQPKPRGGQHGHSHGPAGSGPHGAGTLAHLGAALHSAPQLPSFAAGPPEHAAPAAVTAQLHGTLRHLVPEGSQGPPAAC